MRRWRNKKLQRNKELEKGTMRTQAAVLLVFFAILEVTICSAQPTSQTIMHNFGNINTDTHMCATASGSLICIKTDGSIDPPDVPISKIDNPIYTITGNTTGKIIIARAPRQN